MLIEAFRFRRQERDRGPVTGALAGSYSFISFGRGVLNGLGPHPRPTSTSCTVRTFRAVIDLVEWGTLRTNPEKRLRERVQNEDYRHEILVLFLFRGKSTPVPRNFAPSVRDPGIHLSFP